MPMLNSHIQNAYKMIPLIATTINRLSRYSLALSLSSIPDAVRDKLDTTVRHFSHLVALSTITVALGVLLEGIELVHVAIEWRKRKRREKRERSQIDELRRFVPIRTELRKFSKPHSEEPIWAKRILRVGLILVVVGVVGEWRCGAKLEDAHNAVHTYDLEKIREADEKAGDAATSAKTARAEADAATTASREAQSVANTAEASALEAQGRVTSVSQQAGK